MGEGGGKGGRCSRIRGKRGQALGSFFQFHASSSHRAKGFNALWVSVTAGPISSDKCFQSAEKKKLGLESQESTRRGNRK